MCWGGGSQRRKQYVQRPSALLWGQMSSGRSTKPRAEDTVEIPQTCGGLRGVSWCILCVLGQGTCGYFGEKLSLLVFCQLTIALLGSN